MRIKAAPEYADSLVWDERHQTNLESGTDIDQVKKWLNGLLSTLAEFGVRELLDLGCGTGYDCLELARRGIAVTGIDHSKIALDRARALAQAENLAVRFIQVDAGKPLPFPNADFDAVMSNLVLHSFSDGALRQIIGEVWRCLKPGGLLLFHANSTEDLPYRTKRQPIVRQLGADFYQLAGGQTMHFFSEEYCRELLAEWLILQLANLRTLDSTGDVLKCALRCVAQKPV
jgi:SAM-dependent methyltransferase